MGTAKRLVLILVPLVGCVACDQATKAIAQSHLSPGQVWSFLGDSLRLQLAHNHGAFLSLGAALPEFWRHALFNVLVGVLLMALLGYALVSRRMSSIALLAAGLLIGGGFSNLMDRWAHGGYVVDFINLGLGPWRTGILNFADICITAGVLILLVDGLRYGNKNL